MTFAEVMAQLEALGTEQNRKIYRRHGAGENQFGVSFANLRKLAKQIKKDNALAAELWASGNQDARSLATLIADPKTLSAGDLKRWVADIDYYVIADVFAGNIAGLSPHARELAEKWTRADHEYAEQTGWNVVSVLAMRDKALPDAWFEGYMDRIEREIEGAKNRVRHAMNGALIAIGLRNQALSSQAREVAGRIGRVVVDHGETGCVTPEASPYIERGWARRKSA